jgi:U3 small nucleolar RNA-associated protein 10
MPSSLATQLAQGASINSAFLADRARRKPTQSYLFTGREADKHDLESIHALAWNAFVQLRQWNPALQSYETPLFSDAAKGLDRTLLPANEAKELNAKISAFLPLLGKDLMEMPTGRVLEWLVRRFRCVLSATPSDFQRAKEEQDQRIQHRGCLVSLSPLL